MHEFRPRIPLSRKWIVSIHAHAFERQNGWTSAIKWLEDIENENEWWTTVESRRSSCDTILSFLLDWFVALIITARKRSLRRLCFYRCLSVHGGHVWQGGMHGGGGMCGRGCAWQGGMHGVGQCMAGGVHGRGACMPPQGIWWDTVNERAVCILLEWILVSTASFTKSTIFSCCFC